MIVTDRERLLSRITYGEVGLRNILAKSIRDGDDEYAKSIQGQPRGLGMARVYIDEVLPE